MEKLVRSKAKMLKKNDIQAKTREIKQENKRKIKNS